jgi:hypothetical protein
MPIVGSSCGLSCNAIVALQIGPNAASGCELLHTMTAGLEDLRHSLVMTGLENFFAESG